MLPLAHELFMNTECTIISGVARGVLRGLEHPLSQKRKKNRIGILKMLFAKKLIHKNRYLHQNICL